MITVKYQDLDPLQFSYSKSKLSLLLWQQYRQALLAKRKNCRPALLPLRNACAYTSKEAPRAFSEYLILPPSLWLILDTCLALFHTDRRVCAVRGWQKWCWNPPGLSASVCVVPESCPSS